MNQLICKKCGNIQDSRLDFCLKCKVYIQNQDCELKWWHIPLWIVTFIPLTCYGIYLQIQEYRY